VLPGIQGFAPREQQEAQAAWQAMCRLIDKVTYGGRPDPCPQTVALRQGEIQHGALHVEAQVFHSTTVEYTTGGYAFGGGLLFVGAGMAAGAIRDANVKRRAEQEAAAQWRPVGLVPCAVTSQRLLIQDSERQWQSYPLHTLVSLTPELPAWALVLAFESSAPVRLRGPWVPWLTVVITALQFRRPWPNGFPPPIVPGPRQRPMQFRSSAPGIAAGQPSSPVPGRPTGPQPTLPPGPVPDAGAQDHIRRLRELGSA
jgi:hypothetical protein